MEGTAARVCSVLFFHFTLILGGSIHIGTGTNYSGLYHPSILPCKKEELQCGDGRCHFNWLPCHYKKDCGTGYMSIQITCSNIHLNQSGAVSKLSHYTEHSGDTNLMGSSVMVAGMVIGVVLFLSCVTIFVGSLRKDRRLRHPHLRRDPCYTPDGFSYGGSVGELRSSCIDEFPPALDFSYVETLSQVNIMHPDSPPRLLRRAPAPDEWHPPPSMPVPIYIDKDTHYEVNQILDSRLHKGRLQYLVDWKDFPSGDKEWVEAGNVKAPRLLRAFHRAFPDCPRPVDAG
ncbi:protein BEAN1 isoform X2 [Paroedura picta]|uniref:protein BEAN1 isoform X2 n=1 Tax=Paroedura picta TaxID=143630 RepID=UPI004056EAEE